MVHLKPNERERFWADIEKFGTPHARLASSLAKRKAAWVKEGMVARVGHLRGEEKLRHATIQAIGDAEEIPDSEGRMVARGQA